MFTPVALPLWLFLVMLLLAGWSLLERLLLPSVRWYLRRRVNRVIDELNTRLRIKIQPFKLTKRRVLIDRLVYDPQVLAAMEEFAREEKMPREVAVARVRRYAEEIVPAFNAYLYFRIGSWIARRVAQMLYRVRLGFADEGALEQVPEDATVVFVMNHRSNMDYVLVAYMVAARSALSYAVGEWARIWPLDTLIRAMGAYFVRRRSRDELYRRVLQRYVQMATAHGVTQAMYPEGGLSRDGRLQAPKLGLLDYMLRDFDPAGERDVVFVPVGINYDRTLEDRTLLLDLVEKAPPKSPWQATLNTFSFLGHNLGLMLRGRWYRFGYACVNFGAPISMRDYLQRRQVDLRRLDREPRFAAIEELAREIMAAVASIVPVLPVALVATVFVHRPQQSLGELEIKARVQELIEQLERHGARLYVPRQDRDYAVTVGLRMLRLRRLVSEHDGLLRAEPEQLPVLRYYANSIAHFLQATTAA